MCLGYLSEILRKVGREKEVENYEKSAYKLINAINKEAYNGKFYDAVFTDNGTKLLSEKDEDGEKRVYIPTNAYAVISGVADGKDDSIFSEIAALKTSDGYKLFSEPLGGKYIDGIGKNGNGRFSTVFRRKRKRIQSRLAVLFDKSVGESGEIRRHKPKCWATRCPFTQINIRPKRPVPLLTR